MQAGLVLRQGYGPGKLCTNGNSANRT